MSACCGLAPAWALPLEGAVNVRDRLANVVLLGHSFLYQLAGVEHGAVVASAERVADFIQRRLSKFAGQIHCHLARKSDAGGGPPRPRPRRAPGPSEPRAGAPLAGVR